MSMVPLMAHTAEDVQSTGLPWWFWLILIVVIVAIFLWLWLSGKKEPTETPVVAKKEIVEPVEAQIAPPSQVDDLKIIEGIGPKINMVLHEAGIATFADLAQADVEQLKKILLDANLRLADPTSWSQQAALARDGKMDELKALQDSLTAGRA